MTPEAAIKDAKKNALLPVYLVTGPEQWLRDQVTREVRAAALTGGLEAFNEDKFTAGEVDVDKVIAAARTVPMMSKRRFVLVRSAERWDGAASDDSDVKKDSPLDRLMQYVAEPVDSTCLVIVAAKLDGRRKLAMFAKKEGFVVQCDPLSADKLASWLALQCRDKGHRIEPDVADLLAELAGPDMACLYDAIERLSLFVGPGKPIDEHAVSECVARVRTADTWALVDAIGRRDLGRAMTILSDIYDPRDRGLPLLGAIAWSIRQLGRLEAALEKGMTMDDAARAAAIYPPFRAREMSQKLKAFGPRELERWILVLAETDVALKSSRRPADGILDDMLTRMCRRGAAA